MPSRAAISFSADGDFQRMRAAFELAWAGNDRDRQIIAELDLPEGDDWRAVVVAFTGKTLVSPRP